MVASADFLFSYCAVNVQVLKGVVHFLRIVIFPS